jgi:hypothetical protein
LPWLKAAWINAKKNAIESKILRTKQMNFKKQ